MVQRAFVVRHEGRLMAEVTRSEACQSCHACRFGQQEKVYVAVDGLVCEEGDEVEIELDNGEFSRASFVAYGVPVISCVALLFLSRLFTRAEGVQALFAAAGLALGLLFVKLFDIKSRGKGDFTPKIKLIDKE